MRRHFTVYAAPADEANEGWVWFNSGLPTRTIVRVLNTRTRRSVYCASRKIDENFLVAYNERPHTAKIEPEELSRALVINQWYRDALGGFATSATSDGRRVLLTILPAKVPLWGSVRAACHHPDIVARIGTRLGVLGAWLGLVGLVPPLFALWGISSDKGLVGSAQLVVAVIGGIVGWLACRGVRPPSRGSC